MRIKSIVLVPVPFRHVNDEAEPKKIELNYLTCCCFQLTIFKWNRAVRANVHHAKLINGNVLASKTQTENEREIKHVSTQKKTFLFAAFPSPKGRATKNAALSVSFYIRKCLRSKYLVSRELFLPVHRSHWVNRKRASFEHGKKGETNENENRPRWWWSRLNSVHIVLAAYSETLVYINSSERHSELGQGLHDSFIFPLLSLPC